MSFKELYNKNLAFYSNFSLFCEKLIKMYVKQIIIKKILIHFLLNLVDLVDKNHKIYKNKNNKNNK